ncbi:cupin domain-containing protein [Nocardia sp. JMUB6875]|uniref:cupin domain-containing protein n=1 Tax=Nocardia sp. JMUB6875 TaxID=3158170 RepID=UPI0032E62528
MQISSTATTTPAPVEWITGEAWFETLVAPSGTSRTQVDSVRFAPGARTVWHRHVLGQTLTVTEGIGLVQRRGGPVETIRTGDTVRIEPGEWHWHGATSTSGMTHIAIEEIPEHGASAEPGAAVGESEYRNGDPANTEPAAPVSRSIVLDQALPTALAVQRVEVRRITIAPGHAAGLHVHNGPVFGSIETGSAVYQIDGERPVVLRPGDVFYEPEGARVARFDGQDSGVTFLGYFLLDAGQIPEIEFPGA